MKTRSKLLFAAITAVFVLSLGAGTAAALRSIETGGIATAEASARALTFEGGGSRVICEVTLNLRNLPARGSGISKVERSAVGNATARVNEAGCRSGRAIPLNTREGWPVTYISFRGTLPRIESIRLQLNGTAFLVSAFGGFGECLFRGNAQGTTGGGTTVTEVRADERVTLGLETNLNGLFCPATGNFRGTFLVFNPREGVRLTLI
jgi:hypothetical protein